MVESAVAESKGPSFDERLAVSVQPAPATARTNAKEGGGRHCSVAKWCRTPRSLRRHR